MKKISLVLVSLTLCFTLLALVGCGGNTTSETVDLASIPEGTELSVYPKCEFDYKYKKGSDEYIFHISSISAKLTKKNSIGTNDLIEGDFYRYEITISVSGYTDSSLAGHRFYLCLLTEFEGWAVICNIDNSGKFNEAKVVSSNNQNFPQITFWRISNID